MSQSLEKLVANLPKVDLKCTSEIFKDKALDVMSQKGVYPYDYMDSFEKLNQTIFPSKEQFYSQLNNDHISDEDYKHAKRVYKGFGLKNLGKYHDLYLLSDVFLLADAFENFRKTFLQYY